jgi:hypothetical protein
VNNFQAIYFSYIALTLEVYGIGIRGKNKTSPVKPGGRCGSQMQSSPFHCSYAYKRTQTVFYENVRRRTILNATLNLNLKVHRRNQKEAALSLNLKVHRRSQKEANQLFPFHIQTRRRKKAISVVLGAVYTCDFVYRSAHDSVYDLLPKFSMKLNIKLFLLKCVDWVLFRFECKLYGIVHRFVHV